MSAQMTPADLVEAARGDVKQLGQERTGLGSAYRGSDASAHAATARAGASHVDPVPRPKRRVKSASDLDTPARTVHPAAAARAT